MKRVALAALLAAAALTAAGGGERAGPEAHRPPWPGAAHFGYMGSGNHHEPMDASH